MPAASDIAHGFQTGEGGSDVHAVQALIVTDGPFEGCICQNDDDEIIWKSEVSESEIYWALDCGVRFRLLSDDELEEFQSNLDQLDEELTPDNRYVVDCQIVTFGYYMMQREYHIIPNQFLRPANMKDLVERAQVIQNGILEHTWSPKSTLRPEHRSSLLLELLFILEQIRERELAAESFRDVSKSVFLCHASADKPYVRRVHMDLCSAGHAAWIDEFEIKVGESIVEKIESATETADFVVLFLSKSSAKSDWVKREWQSTLSRRLSGQNVELLPALIEDAPIPSLMSDIKYADFRESYRGGLRELLRAIGATRSSTDEDT